MDTKKIKGIVVAAPASGSGKTTITLGLLAALTRKGIDTAAFKIGPDFIDPGLHGEITGQPGRNLDGWMLDQNTNLEIFSRGADGAKMAVVEGVMGLYDGFSGGSEAGSTAQMAKWLGLPVLLVVDAGRMARSFAAMVKGFVEFDPKVRFCGVVANNAGSPAHIRYLEEAMADISEIALLGAIPKDAGVGIPERHLGLFTAEDKVISDQRTHALADLVSTHTDLDRLITGLDEIPLKQLANRLRPEPVVRVAVAKDPAFCFYYQDNLDVLEEQGCQIVFFSPVNDTDLPENIHGIYLGGGYPELYAQALSENLSMRRALQTAVRADMPVYAECGGFMYLCKSLEDQNGQIFEMAGVFGFQTVMAKRLCALGYRQIRFLKNTPLDPAGTVVRGHEFHYSFIRDPKADKTAPDVYETADRAGKNRTAPGWLTNQCLGSYVHLHFRSQPQTGRNFANACAEFQNKRENIHETPRN
ncbi:MAG: cobyrinate a,c-diamide synthase [Desulfosalsimonas sp.]|uniref:cobyrinate a,c-diamide synthase n=1 Tax=Desulfosalsimonas sp. TaxID=3073848 RepID=UPI00397067AA